MNNKKIKILSFLVIASVLFSGIFFNNESNISAATSSVSGYAWSDNIGWIDFNPLYGGVSIDEVTGLFSGYAWSDNIGWIDFAPTSGYPEAPNQGVKLEADGSLSGWAHALSFGGGWDGWIKFSGSGYGVVNNGGVLDGYAWGSDVIGWILFDSSGVIITDPVIVDSTTVSVSLVSDPQDIFVGETSTLTWTSVNTTSCSADWDGSITITNGQDIVSPIVTTTYTIICSGPLGSATDSVIVNVDLVPGVVDAVDDTAVVNENSFVNINNLSNDTGDGIFVESVTNPSCGSVVNNVSSVRYVNSSYCSGSDSFTYTVEDSSGNQDTATVNITIYDCGDGTVQGSEQCDLGVGNGICPATCSTGCIINSGCPVCGNGVCEAPTETTITCPGDCLSSDPSVCGNGICESDESFFTCSIDCPATFIEF